jgi:hypothetical protein
MVYRNGGPANSRFVNVSPSTIQTLAAGGTITFSLNFTSGDFQWVSLASSDPGLPGDGLFGTVGGALTFAFQFSSAIPISQAPDGFSVTVFPGPGTPRLEQLQLNYRRAGDTTLSCGLGSNAGISRRVAFNGVEGAVTYHSQQSLVQSIQVINSTNPSCGLSLSNLELHSVSAISSAGLITTADAISVGFGTAGFPGTTTP